MSRKYRVIFTDNKQSDQGIMSVILGTLCSLSLIYSFVVSYMKEGEISNRFGGALFLTLVFSGVGLALGVIARMDNTKFKLLPTIGIVVNAAVMIVLAFLLWVGLR